MTIDIIRENFLYSALVDYFPGSHKGGHLVPTEEEILKERSRLARTILDFNPEILVTVGKLSVSYALQKDIKLLSEVIGKRFNIDPYGLLGKEIVVIPLPHPSGASTWRHKKENKILLERALKLLKDLL